jgi:hypothetical protein
MAMESTERLAAWPTAALTTQQRPLQPAATTMLGRQPEPASPLGASSSAGHVMTRIVVGIKSPNGAGRPTGLLVPVPPPALGQSFFCLEAPCGIDYEDVDSDDKRQSAVVFYPSRTPITQVSFVFTNRWERPLENSENPSRSRQIWNAGRLVDVPTSDTHYVGYVFNEQAPAVGSVAQWIRRPRLDTTGRFFVDDAVAADGTVIVANPSSRFAIAYAHRCSFRLRNGAIALEALQGPTWIFPDGSSCAAVTHISFM